MARRFTDSRKWDDEWFLDLPNKHKLLWLYLVDKCDHAGVYKHSQRLEKCCLSESYDWEMVIESFGNRIVKISDTKYFIPKFLKFQYPAGLNSQKPSIIGVRKLLKEHGLDDVVREKLGKEFLIVSESLANDYLTNKVKDKDKVKVKDKVTKGGSGGKYKSAAQKLLDQYKAENGEG